MLGHVSSDETKENISKCKVLLGLAEAIAKWDVSLAPEERASEWKYA